MVESIRTTITGPIGNLQADVVPISSDPTKSWLVVANADWSSVAWEKSKYVLSDVDETSNPLYTYLWYIASDGAWYIARITNADSSFRYSKGTSDYVTNWTNRASLTYNVGL